MRLLRLTILLALATVVHRGVAAETQEYLLNLPENRRAAYTIDFDVTHAGLVEMEAEWSGSRVVSFRLKGPDVAVRRTGPPPLHFEIEVDREMAASEETWTLSIRSLPARQGGQGRLRLRFPDSAPPEPVEPLPQAEPPDAPLEPWQLPGTAPAAASGPVLRLFETTERFREIVVEERDEVDGYRWQDALLRYLVRHRDDLARGKTSTLSAPTRHWLTEFVSAIRNVEELRTTDDPILSGPPPRDLHIRRSWLTLRRERVAPIERQLDKLLNDLDRGHAPELEREDWLRRWLSCLIACERFFEQRDRLGAELAAHRRVAELQWETILAAAEAVESLLVVGEPPVRLGRNGCRGSRPTLL